MSDCGNVKKVFVPGKKNSTEKETPKQAPVSGIEISDVAAEKIKLFLTNDGKDPNEYGLWVGVVKDGCSGNSYTMELRELQPCVENGDKLFSKDGANLIIDKLSYLFVIGSILDYVEALTGSGFNLTNPNIKRSCSCGSSFAV